MNLKIIVSAIIGGVVITLLTGQISNTPSGLVGAAWYGYPLAWLISPVVAPESYAWHVEWLNLVADGVFWVVVTGIVLFAVKKARK
jgi:hypothetical protein